MTHGLDEAHPQLAVSIEQTADGVRYMLPPRPWKHRWVAWLLVPVGLAIVAAASFVANVAFNAQSPSAPTSFDIVMSIVVGVMMLIGLALCLWGYWGARACTSLLLRSEVLAVINTAWPLRWTRQITALDVVRLVIVEDANVQQVIGTAAHLLVAERADGRRRALVKWYPEAVISPVAADLAQRLSLREPIARESAQAVDTDDETVEPPTETSIVLETTEDGLAIVVPPLSLWRSRDGRSLSGAMGGAFAGAGAGMFTIFMMPGFLNQWWIWLAVTIPTLIGGIIVTLGVLNQRTVCLDVVDDVLLVTRRSLLGIRQKQWTSEQLERIAVGQSEIEISDGQLLELQIADRTGETLRVGTGRARRELRWLAATLRDALGVAGVDAKETAG